MAISYPVDTQNTRWSIYQVSTSTVVARRKRWPTADGNQIPGQDPDFVWLLESNSTSPDFDQWTQKLEALEVISLPENTINYGYQVVQLNQDEIDAITPAHYVASNGLKLDVSDEAQNAFSRMLALINESGMADAETVVIKDIYGARFGLTVGQLRPILVAYGLHCYGLFAA